MPPALEGLTPDPGFVAKFPLPFPPEVFVQLMVPHLKQIRALADFRVKMGRLLERAAAGVSKKELQQRLAREFQEIPLYNTWVGIMGLSESEAQYHVAKTLCKDLGLPFVVPRWYTRTGSRDIHAGQYEKNFRAGNHDIR